MIGHVILFFVASFAQFNYALNKGPGSAILFLTTVAAGVYFLGWWALLTLVVGGMVGGRLAIEQTKKNTEEHEQIEQFIRRNVDD